jgi:pseudooxynicotine dehydrogenase
MLRAVSDPYDVIVIGGGFSGVTAARECAKAGLRTVILEARDRLGGRTHTTVWNGAPTELGGTWVHRSQPYVWAEIERYGLALADSSAGTTGQVVLRRSDGDIAPVDFAVQAVKIFGAVAQYMGASSEMFPHPHRPFETGLAEKHDRVTAADPLADIADPFARDFLDGFVATAVGNRAREAAWVEMVRWYALAGHSYVDLVEALARYRFQDGTKALVDAMVADGKPEVRLGAAVASVEQGGARARVTSRAGEALEARAVIATLPLNVLCDVRFDPALDPRKLEASIQRHAGASTKLHVVIEGEQRVSCLAPSENPLNSLATHHVGNGRTHLIGFGPSPELLDIGDRQQVERAVRLLLPEARVLDSTGWDWNADEFARGTWCTLRPGQYSRHLAALQQPAGRVFFASADWANGWRGNIDGAIEQGLAAARQVRALLA